MISYAGVYLPLATDEIREWVRNHISVREVYEFADMQGTPSPTYPRRPSHQRVELGRLEWPMGASRWAVGHFLVTENDLPAIRAETLTPYSGTPPSNSPGTITQSGGGSIAKPLILGESTRQIIAPMYMLPPRPLSQYVESVPSGSPGGGGTITQSDFNGLFLLTLVDDRFHWWQRRGVISASSADTPRTWNQLYDEFSSILGISIAVDTIPSSYLTPPLDPVPTEYSALPPFLDKIAASVGQRIVRLLDGTVTAQNGATGASVENGMLLADYEKIAGGLFSLRT